MNSVYKTYYHSAIGWLEISGTADAIQQISFVETAPDPLPNLDSLPAVLITGRQQLEEYFQGTRHHFTFSLDPPGTPFQQRVWQQLQQIPHGQTISYLELSRVLGNEKAIRAVGRANGSNPIVIVIPCHRVIGQDGKLTGYGGGLWRKRWLLDHEQRDRPILTPVDS